jgi:hypothetical protein
MAALHGFYRQLHKYFDWPLLTKRIHFLEGKVRDKVRSKTWDAIVVIWFKNWAGRKTALFDAAAIVNQLGSILSIYTKRMVCEQFAEE